MIEGETDKQYDMALEMFENQIIFPCTTEVIDFLFTLRRSGLDIYWDKIILLSTAFVQTLLATTWLQVSSELYVSFHHIPNIIFQVVNLQIERGKSRLIEIARQ